MFRQQAYRWRYVQGSSSDAAAHDVVTGRFLLFLGPFCVHCKPCLPAALFLPLWEQQTFFQGSESALVERPHIT